MNNYPQGEFDASHSSGFPSPASVDISYESAVFDNLFFEQLGNDKSIFTPPDMNNRIGCNGNLIKIVKFSKTSFMCLPNHFVQQI